ncbi:MAG: hypothetical protein HYU48_02430 [Candidatus Levybacteria bacterium]|nr:hypothetical protein [Candidatus Levybacteria bacterium]
MKKELPPPQRVKAVDSSELAKIAAQRAVAIRRDLGLGTSRELPDMHELNIQTRI